MGLNRYVYVPHVPIEALVLIVAIVLVTFASQQIPNTIVSREESSPSFMIESGIQYPVSEILERQGEGAHFMPPFVKSSDSPGLDDRFTALVGNICFSQGPESETTTFTAIAARPVAVVITLYDENGKICGEVKSQSSPPFPRETAKSFFSIDSDGVTLLVANISLEGAKTISIDYVTEDRTKPKGSIPLFLFPQPELEFRF